MIDEEEYENYVYNTRCSDCRYEVNSSHHCKYAESDSIKFRKSCFKCEPYSSHFICSAFEPDKIRIRFNNYIWADENTRKRFMQDYYELHKKKTVEYQYVNEPKVAYKVTYEDFYNLRAITDDKINAISKWYYRKDLSAPIGMRMVEEKLK